MSALIGSVQPAQRSIDHEHPVLIPASVSHQDRSDPERQAFELAQRGRMILDVVAADMMAAEALFGPFHDTSWYFRQAFEDARRSWDRLRAELGGDVLDAALRDLPLTHLTLGIEGPDGPQASLFLLGGQTYHAQRVAGTPLAPIQWRLTRLLPPLDDGPYYACRLRDGSTQCDCADWTFRIAETDSRRLCKHLAALESFGWI